MQYESPVMEVTVLKKRVVVQESTLPDLGLGDGSDLEFGEGGFW